jgi:hypothetical protein
MEAITKFRNASIIPVSQVAWDLQLDRPFQVDTSLTFENAAGLLKPEMFDLWRELVPKRERDDLSSVRFALMHRFGSTDYVGREEALSDEYAYKVFLCLRLIKPTKSVFQRIQVRLLDNDKLEVTGFQHPGIWPNIPDFESINDVDLEDVKRLKALLPTFLTLASSGPENIRRAVRHFNVGYTELQDPTTQIVLWMMGIEALFGSEHDSLQREVLFRRLDDSVGLQTDIYDSSPMREYIGQKSFKVGDLVGDLVTLRDRLVHGQWVPPEWKGMEGRNGLISAIPYPDVLREAASFILRKAILKYLEDKSRLDARQ